MTAAGIVGTWYFDEAELSKGFPLCRPAVCTPFARACTRLLGPISFGSLVLATVRTIVALVKAAERSVGESHWVAKIALCCVHCCLKCVERCVEWLTSYAYVYVALYGTSFVQGGKEVMELLAAKGLDSEPHAAHGAQPPISRARGASARTPYADAAARLAPPPQWSRKTPSSSRCCG